MSHHEPKPKVDGIRTVGVPVTDQDRSIAFYVGTLGFEKRMDVEFRPGQRWIEVAPAGATTTIALMPTPEDQPTGIDTHIRLETNDAEADHSALQKRGASVDGELLRFPGVPPMFELQDPDGNRLIIVERMRGGA